MCIRDSITGVSTTTYNAGNTDNDIVFDIEGVNSSNYQKYFDIANYSTIEFGYSDYPKYGRTDITSSDSYNFPMSGSWNSDYSKLTFSWTNPSNITTGSSAGNAWTAGKNSSGGVYDVDFFFGAKNSSALTGHALAFSRFRFSQSTNELVTSTGIGADLPSSSNKFLLNPYFDLVNHNTATSYARTWTSTTRRYVVDGFFDERVGIQGQNGFNNDQKRFTSPYYYDSFYRLDWDYAHRYTSGSNVYTYSNGVSSSHDLYDEIHANSNSNSAGPLDLYRLSDNSLMLAGGGFAYSSEPDLNSDIVLYRVASLSNRSSYVGLGADNDYKMVISFGASRSASDFSWKIYVNSTTGTGTVTWVELERFYPFGSNV